MRLTALLPTLSLAASVAAWSDYENSVKCGRKNPDVNTAIQRFCSKQDIVVPSLYANAGVAVGGAHVAISGKCNPPQWVPFEYCRMQFAKLCAHGNARGFGNQRYGNGRCQGWHIDVAKHPKKRDAMPDALAEAMREAEEGDDGDVAQG